MPHMKGCEKLKLNIAEQALINIKEKRMRVSLDNQKRRDEIMEIKEYSTLTDKFHNAIKEIVFSGTVENKTEEMEKLKLHMEQQEQKILAAYGFPTDYLIPRYYCSIRSCSRSRILS